jgi:Holliday junction resolvasome RuvABC endonuclease subunit
MCDGHVMILGLDLSLTSPGMVVYDQKHHAFYSYFEPCRKREHGMKQTSNFMFRDQPHTFEITALPISSDKQDDDHNDDDDDDDDDGDDDADDGDHDDDADSRELELQLNNQLYERYNKILNSVLTIISRHSVTQVVIEGYAYGVARLSSSGSKMYELGGIIRHALMQLQHVNFKDVSPTQLKRKFTGSGRATKNAMYESFISKGLPDLARIFKVQNCKNIPNPVQDIVDATALVLEAVDSAAP